MRFLVCAVAALVAAAASGLVAAEDTLYERNYRTLLATLPEGSVMEVWVNHGGEMVPQLWTAEQYADARATFAALLGRDYTSGAEGLPSGTGEVQYVGSVYFDAFGTLTTNVALGRGLPTTIPVDSKLWVVGGPSSNTGVWEFVAEPPCFGFLCAYLCSFTMPQECVFVDRCWLGGTGVLFAFPPPYGGYGNLDGMALCDPTL